MHGAEVHEHTIGKTKMRVIIEISRFFAASSGTCEAERKRRRALTLWRALRLVSSPLC